METCQIQTLTVRSSFPSIEPVHAEDEVTPQVIGVESGVESPIVRAILSFLTDSALSKLEIARKLGKEKPTRYLNDLMVNLLESAFVEYTIPDKPNSRLQQYRLTEKGKAMEGSHRK